MDPDLDFIVWHDAMLDRIVRNLTEVRLDFSDAPIYRKIQPGLWDWEEGDVALLLLGAEVECAPPGDERTTLDSRWVMDCTRSEPMDCRDIQALGRGVGPGHIAFVMADGSTVGVAFQHAKLTIVGPLVKIKRYSERPKG